MQGRIAAIEGGGKARRFRSALTLAAVALAASFTTACSSDSKPSPHGLPSTRNAGGSSGNGAGGNGATGGGGTSGATGGTSTVIVTGGSNGMAAGAGMGTGASAGSGMDGECQGETFAAMRVPLDLYVMLDSSESMLERTGTTTKWDAVGNAIRSFVNDDSSAGIGIGLQFFPLQDADAPEICRSDADCTGFGVCNQRFCQDAGPDYYGCATNADCVFNGDNLGPCAPLTHCWSEFIDSGGYISLCHNDGECGLANDCIPFAHCGTDENLLCSIPGRTCTDPDGNSLGACVEQGLPSKCEHWATCEADAYAAPAVAIAELPAVAPSIIATIAGKDPEGNTPSAPALAGAIQRAHDWALAHEDHEVAVVLATDGLPSECIADTNGDPSGIVGVTTAAAAGIAGDPSVRTFVIGVFSESDTDAPMNLDAIAKAGGTEEAFMVSTGDLATGADVEQQFLEALDAIRGSGISCELRIPVPTSGTADFDRVNVYFTEGDQTEVLYYAMDEAGCESGKGDWYYGLDDSGHPNKIIACPAACERFQASTSGSVKISVGCRTVVR